MLGERSPFNPNLINIHFFCLSYFGPSVSVAWCLCWTGKMLKSDHQGRFKDSAVTRESWVCGRDPQGLREPGLRLPSPYLQVQEPCSRNKNLASSARSVPRWSPLEQKRLSQSVIKQCFSKCINFRVAWRSCSNANSDPVGLGWGLSFCIPKRLQNDSEAAGLRTTVASL